MGIDIRQVAERDRNRTERDQRQTSDQNGGLFACVSPPREVLPSILSDSGYDSLNVIPIHVASLIHMFNTSQ